MRVLSRLTNPKGWMVRRVLILDPHHSHVIPTRPYLSGFYFLNNGSPHSDAVGSPIYFHQSNARATTHATKGWTKTNAQPCSTICVRSTLFIATCIDIYVVLGRLSTQLVTNQNNLHNINLS
jgi:hypothetical protein